MNMKRKDFLMVAIAGFFTSLFLLPTLKNVKLLGISNAFYLFMAGLPILWVLALVVGRFLNRWLGWIYQFVKFCVIGFLNASIDFGVLNLLSLYTGITSGFILGGVNVPGFIIAATNSYFWNKFWVFSHQRQEGPPAQAGEKVSYGDLPTFIAVVVSGALVNSGLVVFISTYFHPVFGMSAERWLNISKVAASAAVLAWNFIGFRVFVFKSKENQLT